MTLQEIKSAVDRGLTVCWFNPGYVVVKDSLGQYLIKFTANGHCIGLTNRAGDQLNGQPEDFFVSVLMPRQQEDGATSSPQAH